MTLQNDSTAGSTNPSSTRRGDASSCNRSTEAPSNNLVPWERGRPVRCFSAGVRRRGLALAAIVGVAVALGWTRMALTQSGTATLNSSGDTYLKQGTPNINQGTETLLRIQQSGDNRVLLKFDQPALEQAVGSSSIRSAKLRLYIASNANNWGSDGREVNVHRLMTRKSARSPLVLPPFRCIKAVSSPTATARAGPPCCFLLGPRQPRNYPVARPRH